MTTFGTDKRARLALLWVFVMLNMIVADVLSFMSPGALEQILAGRAGEIVVTPGFLLLAAVLTEVPITMVLLSLVLPLRAARWANLAAALFTVVYIWGMGSPVEPHYAFIAAVETLGCVLIARTAWTWRESATTVPAHALATE